MELIQAHQVPFEELLHESVDILIAACGYESRSCHLIQLSNFNANKKIALLFKEEQNDETRKQNEAIFNAQGFKCYEFASSATNEIQSLLETLCESKKSENIKLVLDYSSMTKTWFGTIINYFSFNELDYNNLIVYFCYTPEFFIPPAASKNKLSKPEPIFSNQPSVNKNKPLALLIGLGDDESKVKFLCDFFKPDDVFLFMPNPSFDEKYTQMVRNNHKNILSHVKSNHLLSYPAANIEEIDSQITSICLNLRLNYRTILISLGPKTFSLASFLLNARYPDIEIWNMSSAINCLDLKPSGVPIVYKAVLTNQDDAY
jgi:hypothetical protein